MIMTMCNCNKSWCFQGEVDMDRRRSCNVPKKITYHSWARIANHNFYDLQIEQFLQIIEHRIAYMSILFSVATTCVPQGGYDDAQTTSLTDSHAMIEKYVESKKIRPIYTFPVHLTWVLNSRKVLSLFADTVPKADPSPPSPPNRKSLPQWRTNAENS